MAPARKMAQSWYTPQEQAWLSKSTSTYSINRYGEMTSHKDWSKDYQCLKVMRLEHDLDIVYLHKYDEGCPRCVFEYEKLLSEDAGEKFYPRSVVWPEVQRPVPPIPVKKTRLGWF